MPSGKSNRGLYFSALGSLLKIDVEGVHAALLRAIFAAGSRPPYISAECLSIKVFQVLVEQAAHRPLKLIEGSAVSQPYTDRTVANHATQQAVPFSFPPRLAGQSATPA